MRSILLLIWQGLWMGFGMEISVFIIWLGWIALHGKVAHKLEESSFFHRIHKYFE
jgi:hypothetical protein